MRHKANRYERARAAGRALLLCLLWCLPLAATAAITVHDDLGHSVTLAQPAERIVALAPHVTELLFAAGAGDNVVGVASHSDWPPAARQLARVGGASGVSLEKILMLQPDLVVAWASGNGADVIARLRQLDLVVYVSEPRTLLDIAQTIEELGRLAGTYAQASRAAADFRTRLQALSRYRDKTPVSVLYQIWHDPLMTINGTHYISQIIRLCGGRNVFADLRSVAPQVSVEAVLAAQPDVIIASGTGDKRPAWLDHWRNWPMLPAVTHDHLYFIPPDLIQRPTPRILQGARKMCRLLDTARSDE